MDKLKIIIDFILKLLGIMMIQIILECFGIPKRFTDLLIYTYIGYSSFYLAVDLKFFKE